MTLMLEEMCSLFFHVANSCFLISVISYRISSENTCLVSLSMSVTSFCLSFKVSYLSSSLCCSCLSFSFCFIITFSLAFASRLCSFCFYFYNFSYKSYFSFSYSSICFSCLFSPKMKVHSLVSMPGSYFFY